MNSYHCGVCAGFVTCCAEHSACRPCSCVMRPPPHLVVTTPAPIEGLKAAARALLGALPRCTCRDQLVPGAYLDNCFRECVHRSVGEQVKVLEDLL